MNEITERKVLKNKGTKMKPKSKTYNFKGINYIVYKNTSTNCWIAEVNSTELLTEDDILHKKTKHRKTFQSKKDKNSIINKMNEYIDRTLYNINLNKKAFYTLDKNFKDFIINCHIGKSKSNYIKTLKETYDCHIKEALGHRLVNEISKEDIKNLLDSQNKNYVSESLIKKTKSALTTFFEYLIDEEILDCNPAKNIKLPKKMNNPTKKRKKYSNEEIDAFKNALKSNEPWIEQVYPIFILALETGLREAEITGLKWSDIKEITVRSKKCKYIVLQRQLTYTNIYDAEGNKLGKILKEERLKTKSSYRKIPLKDDVVDALNKLKNSNNTSDTYIFTNTNGLPYKPSDLLKLFKKLAKKANVDVKNRGLHSLRHTVASTLALKGLNPFLLKNIIGHSSIKTTDQYYIDTEIEDLINSMDELGIQ